MAKAWDLDGYFKVDVRDDGVFLTVYAPMGEGEPVKVEEIMRQIQQREIEGVDRDLVELVIKETSGLPVKIAGTQAKEVKPSFTPADLLVVEVTEDEMAAYLTVLSPGGENVTLEDVKSALKREGVTYGIDEGRISTLLREKEFNRAVVVARGRPAVPGQDAVITFKFRKERKGLSPEVEEGGRVDYRKLNLVENAVSGQVLVTKSLPTKGTPGMTVRGREINAPDGEDVPIPAGKNTEISQDGLQLIATISGQPVWTGTRVDVEPVFEVKGDVDFSVGNIDFVGSLVINGDIKDGFEVKATNDIEVKGSIEMADVSAGGDIVVHNGILGKEGGNVFAQGDITAKFIENANVEAMGNLFVQESIMHSYVDAGGSVVLAGGKHGNILGGRVRAGKEVNARVIGSWTETPTEVEVGIAPRTREEIIKLEREIEEDKKNFRELKLGIKTLLNLKERLGKLSQEKEELLTKYLRAQNMLMSKLRDTTTRVNLLQKELTKEAGGQVCVFDVVYPGTKISIRTTTMYIKEEYKYATFVARGGKIEFKPYEEPKLTKRERRGRA
jgi:hypothetical protein